jgi:hypothetical protein
LSFNAPSNKWSKTVNSAEDIDDKAVRVETVCGVPKVDMPVDGKHAQFLWPTACCMSSDYETLYVLDGSGIRAVDYRSGVTHTILEEPRSELEGAQQIYLANKIELNQSETALFVNDRYCIRQVEIADGKVSTLCGHPTMPGNDDGSFEEARFWSLVSARLDRINNLLYVLEVGAVPLVPSQIRRVDLVKRTVTCVHRFSMAASNGAAYDEPVDLVIDARDVNVLWVTFKHCARKVDLRAAGLESHFAKPDVHHVRRYTALATDAHGQVVLADSRNNCIRVLQPFGVNEWRESVLAGSTKEALQATDDAAAGTLQSWYTSTAIDDGDDDNDEDYVQEETFRDGSAHEARFYRPSDLLVHPLTGDVIVVDCENFVIRKIVNTGLVGRDQECANVLRDVVRFVRLLSSSSSTSSMDDRRRAAFRAVLETLAGEFIGNRLLLSELVNYASNRATLRKARPTNSRRSTMLPLLKKVLSAFHNNGSDERTKPITLAQQPEEQVDALKWLECVFGSRV